MMAWSPTTDQLLDLEVGRRQDSFEFELCDQQWNVIGELHPDQTQAPTIRAEATGPRRLSGLKLPPDQAEDVNKLEDRLRVYMRLQNRARFRLGSFMWGDLSSPERSWGTEHHSELTDLSHILAQSQTRPYGWNRGDNMVLIMLFLLMRAGFPLDKIFVGPEADRGLSEPMSWQPGATWDTMIGDLAVTVGMSDPWVDRNGKVWVVAPPDPDQDPDTVPPYEAGGRIIADSIVPSDDLLDAPNDFAAFHSGTDRIITGRAQIPARAPHSFAKRGFRIGEVESQQGLESQAQANKAARNLRRSKGKSHEVLVFQSTLDPRHDLWDVYRALGKRWLEESWGMQLRSGGVMDHRARRPIYAPS